MASSLGRPLKPEGGHNDLYMLKIGGEEFRQQRSQLARLTYAINQSQLPGLAEARAALEGIQNLCDEIADQAYDVHAIDCLMRGGTHDEEESVRAAHERQVQDWYQRLHERVPVQFETGREEGFTSTGETPGPAEADEENWWLCKGCQAEIQASYGALARSGAPYCSECDQEYSWVGTYAELTAEVDALACERADNSLTGGRAVPEPVELGDLRPPGNEPDDDGDGD